MIKFATGLAIIIFTLVIGSYSYFENQSSLVRKQATLRTLETESTEIKKFSSRMEKVKKLSLELGQDQKSNIDKLLGFTDYQLAFKFTQQDNNVNQKVLKHNFTITGEASYSKIIKTMERVVRTPGFVITSTCLNCKGSVRSRLKDQIPVTIKGVLYVYNPNA